MTTILCIPSPPFGRYFWEKVCDRFAHFEQATKIVTPLSESPNQAHAIRMLDDTITHLNDKVVILTHGSSLKLGLALTANPNVKGVVLTNGSVSKASPLAQIGQHTPQFLMKLLCYPSLATPIFSSSLGMRRWVVNPYTMHRDMVVMVCNEFMQSDVYRNNSIRWVSNNTLPLSPPANKETPCLSIWGTHDFFHPIDERQKLNSILPIHESVEVPGGRYLHPIERPWETADAVLKWLSKMSF